MSISPLAAVTIHQQDKTTIIKALTQRSTYWSLSWRDEEPIVEVKNKTEETSSYVLLLRYGLSPQVRKLQSFKKASILLRR